MAQTVNMENILYFWIFNYANIIYASHNGQYVYNTMIVIISILITFQY